MRTVDGTIWRALGATLAVSLAPTLVSAQEPAAAEGSAVLHYRAPEGCPDESAVRTEIEGLLGRTWASLETRIEIDAEVRESPEGWGMRLRAGHDAERDIAGESCAALAQAAALMIAWMIDPASEATELVPTSTEANVQASTALALAAPDLPARPEIASRIAPHRGPATLLADPTEPLPTRASGTSWSIGFGPTFVADVGTLPSVSPGIGGELVVRIDRLDLRARGEWLSVQRATLANAPVPSGAGADVEWAGGSLHGCGRPFDPGGPGFAICGGLHAGALIARGTGVSHPGQGEIPIGAVGLGVVMPWAPIPELDLEIGAELVVPFATPPFVIGASGMDYAVFTTAPGSGRLTITGHVDVR